MKITNFNRDKVALQTCTFCRLLYSDHKCFFLSTADCIIAYIDTTLCDCISMTYKRQITCRQPEIHGGEDCPKQCYTGHLIAGSKSCSWDDLDAFKCAASRGKPFNIMISLIFATSLTYICSRHPWFKRFHFTVACLALGAQMKSELHKVSTTRSQVDHSVSTTEQTILCLNGVLLIKSDRSTTKDKK